MYGVYNVSRSLDALATAAGFGTNPDSMSEFHSLNASPIQPNTCSVSDNLDQTMQVDFDDASQTSSFFTTYTVFRRVNSGAWGSFETGVTASPRTYAGLAGRTYEFYVNANTSLGRIASSPISNLITLA